MIMMSELALATDAAEIEATGPSMSNLHHELKVLIVTECYKDVDPASIDNDERLIHGRLGLDSLDSLEICHAIKAKYGVHITNGMMARRVMKTIATLAAFIQSEIARNPKK
jgi:acyl carrier protein